MTISTPGIRLQKTRALATTSIVALVASAFAAPQAAYAQTAEPQSAQAPSVEEIVVTGSRIVRDGYEAPTPVSVLGTEELNAYAAVNIADAVNSLPAFASSVTPRTQTATLSSGAAGVNQLNLRGVGTNRTLILLDGRRVINSSLTASNSAPDINALPNGLISRVDVVTGGASAAYGSDALTGVVNFILDREFTGVKGEIQGGITTYRDDKSYNATITGGTPFAGGRGHFLLYGEIGHNDGIHGNSRPWNDNSAAIIENPAYGTLAGQSTTVPQYLVGRQVGLSNGTPGGLITAGPLKGIMFGPGGVPAPFTYGTVTTNNLMSGGDWRISRIDNGLDIDPRLDRYVAYTRLAYDITDTIKAWADFQWSFAHSTSRSNPNRRLGNVTIKADNPFIPGTVLAQMTALKLTQFTMGTVNADIPRFFSNQQRMQRTGAAGLDGSFDAFDSSWKWNAYVQFGMTGLAPRTSDNGITANYLRAVDAVVSNGNIVCRVNADAITTNDDPKCAPYNPMGIGVNNPKALAYVAGTGYRYESLRQNVQSVSISGEPFSSWAGPISLATGVEHRSESVKGFATALDEATAFFAGNYHASQGSFQVTEGFVETLIPLAQDESWAKALDLNAAVRATSYTTSGYVTTWKVGATYTPIDDLRFRATRSRDIRAPNLGELFAAGQTNSGNPLNDPFLKVQIPASFRLTRGNPNLQPEKADTTGLGVVVSPRFFPGFQASVDYYNIDISGAVRAPEAQTVVDLCFAGNTVLCSNIQRDPLTGLIFQVITQPENLRSQKASGLDVEASYRFRLDEINDAWGGSLSIRAMANYVFHLQTTEAGAGAVPLEGAGAIGEFGALNQFSGLYAPYFRGNVSVAYEGDPVTLRMTARRTGSGVYAEAFVQCTSGCPTSTVNRPTIDNNHVDGMTTFDVAATYKPIEGKDISLFVTVENLTNAPPPIIGGNLGSTYYAGMANENFDRIGRTYRAGVRFKM